MNQEKFTDRGKIILRSLANHRYGSAVPREDVEDFLILQEKGFVSAVVAADKESTSYLAPKITAKGLAYLAEYPDLPAPRSGLDWKWIIATTIALAGVVIAYLALN